MGSRWQAERHGERGCLWRVLGSLVCLSTWVILLTELLLGCEGRDLRWRHHAQVCQEEGREAAPEPHRCLPSLLFQTTLWVMLGLGRSSMSGRTPLFMVLTPPLPWAAITACRGLRGPSWGSTTGGVWGTDWAQPGPARCCRGCLRSPAFLARTKGGKHSHVALTGVFWSWNPRVGTLRRHAGEFG